MTPYYADEAVTLYHGDCRDVIASLPSNSLDACVTDPPYELGFMGRKWDASGIAYDKWLWAEVWRVLKPGAHVLAFGGTRTWHRLAVAIEDAGFEVRDSIAWMYGSGFPKSMDVSKAIDRARVEDLEPAAAVAKWLVEQLDARGLGRRDVTEHFGAANIAQQWTTHWIDGAVKPRVPRWEQWLELKSWLDLSDDMDAEVWRLNGRKGKPGDNFDAREVLSERLVEVKGGTWAEQVNSGRYRVGERVIKDTAPATDAAREWQGWGTALKPAFEPIVVARKPLIGTVAENVQQWGTGAINVDGCRIAAALGDSDHPGDLTQRPMGNNAWAENSGTKVTQAPPNPSGRWPANVILDESQAEALDRQSGVQRDGVAVKRNGVTSNGVTGWGKAPVGTPDLGYGGEGGASRFFYTAKASTDERPRVDGVAHPTVKPLDLMQYLVRLVTPPGGTVLEPFAGSGTTLEACIVEGFKCVGIEITDEYLPLIMQRITKPIEVTLL